MGIKFNLGKLQESDKEPQVMHLTLLQLYLVAAGFLDGVFVKEDEYDDSGEVLLHQYATASEEEKQERKREYDEYAKQGGLPPYEELAEFDDLIPIKASYTLKPVDGRLKMVFDQMTMLDLDEQMGYDEDGNLVKASELDEEE